MFNFITMVINGKFNCLKKVNIVSNSRSDVSLSNDFFHSYQPLTILFRRFVLSGFFFFLLHLHPLLFSLVHSQVRSLFLGRKQENKGKGILMYLGILLGRSDSNVPLVSNNTSTVFHSQLRSYKLTPGRSTP